MTTCKSDTTSGEWRVDVKGYPVTVIGSYARDHLQEANREMGKMRMALHRILHFSSDDIALKHAREGLGINNDQ